MRQDDSDGEMGDLIPGPSGKHFTAWLGLRRGTKISDEDLYRKRVSRALSQRAATMGMQVVPIVQAA
jgi:hypothetical protein